MTTEFKDRYIKYLIGQGLTSVDAGKLFDKGSGEFDYGYSPEWYAREELNCYYN
ncbi:MAG: hypothetical protein HOG49_09890 [Candidatus Scalindua sp.]|jgi:hypothetical protein|nr:hypothetical protein [Candidatus Scalindua sp.]